MRGNIDNRGSSEDGHVYVDIAPHPFIRPSDRDLFEHDRPALFRELELCLLHAGRSARHQYVAVRPTHYACLLRLRSRPDLASQIHLGLSVGPEILRRSFRFLHQRIYALRFAIVIGKLSTAGGP